MTATRFRYVPDCVVDVHAFELKRDDGGSIPAVSQALAQTRFAHFAHLVWHLPSGSRFEARLGQVQDYCAHQGVGLIVIRDPGNLASFEILVDPERKPTPAAAVEAFLEERMPRADLDSIEAFVQGAQQ